MYTVLSGPLDLTHHVWCLGNDANPIALKGEAFLNPPLAGECRWGLGNFVAVSDDGELEERAV